jgi:hypothetical protein
MQCNSAKRRILLGRINMRTLIRYSVIVVTLGASSVINAQETPKADSNSPGALTPKVDEKVLYLNASQCPGLAHWHNANNPCATGQTAYLHVCLGLNGENGTSNATIPYNQDHWLHVQQYTSYAWTCGSPTYSPNCPGPWYAPLDRCE